MSDDNKVSRDIRAYAESIGDNVEEVIKNVSIALFSAVIQGTPVDTGRLRMNWQISTTEPEKGEVAGEDLTGEKAIGRVTSFIESNASTAFTLTNNLPYAEVVEYGGYPGDGENTVGGYSKQAPAGMVRVNIRRFETLLAEEAAKVRNNG